MDPLAAVPVLELTWSRFASLTAARAAFSRTPCVYVPADREGLAVRVGMASSGLTARYRGGTGHALDAAMHASGNLVYVTSVDAEACGLVEATLIWEHRATLTYNRVGKLRPPAQRIELQHGGAPPRFR